MASNNFTHNNFSNNFNINVSGNNFHSNNFPTNLINKTVHISNISISVTSINNFFSPYNSQVPRGRAPHFLSSSLNVEPQLAPLPESRRRPRNHDLDDTYEEERPAQRVRTSSSDLSYGAEAHGIISENFGTETAQRPISDHFHVSFGGRVIDNPQELERIFSAPVNPYPPPPFASSNFLSESNGQVQQNSNLSLPRQNSRKRSREDTAEASEDEPARRVRRRGNAPPPARNSTTRRRLMRVVEIPRAEPWIALEPATGSGSENRSQGERELPEPQAPQAQNNGSNSFIDLNTNDSDTAARGTKAFIGNRVVLVKERRLRRYLPQPTAEFVELLSNVNQNKMYVLEVSKPESKDGHMRQFYKVIGKTGNLHKVEITNEPRCDCPKGYLGDLCEHVVFVLVKHLMLETRLRHQAAFLDVALQWMLTRKLPCAWQAPRSVEEQGSCAICTDKIISGHRCQFSMLTWCKRQCGMNFHHHCLMKWAGKTWETESDVKCPNCRESWIFTRNELHYAIQVCTAEHIPRPWGFPNYAGILGMPQYFTDEREAALHRRHVISNGGSPLWTVLSDIVEREPLMGEGVELDAWVEAYIDVYFPEERIALHEASGPDRWRAEALWKVVKEQAEESLLELARQPCESAGNLRMGF